MGFQPCNLKFSKCYNCFSSHATKRLTCKEYFSYMLQKRPHSTNVFQYGQRLFQEFLCLAWSSIKSQRLQFTANHQAELRCELYSELLDDIHADPEEKLVAETILPTTVEGFYRDRMKQIADTTALHYVPEN